ncbi:hypothetical protein HYH03_017940 [Edaphochlamys debaryana]|uniref:Uncharacterized protein n=1 Tax=Edaphochlamys debaryana TaxID=47281 RepID=A0A836BNF6_9CHLO|nr:hypothetical protein HYH03_017940 [Edaphochlamys debaryana]|eukprot:KAG2483206.1 hypothetical protein HYH03_017940 [Edaphochlamys debaryana]
MPTGPSTLLSPARTSQAFAGLGPAAGSGGIRPSDATPPLPPPAPSTAQRPVTAHLPKTPSPSRIAAGGSPRDGSPSSRSGGDRGGSGRGSGGGASGGGGSPPRHTGASHTTVTTTPSQPPRHPTSSASSPLRSSLASSNPGRSPAASTSQLSFQPSLPSRRPPSAQGRSPSGEPSTSSAIGSGSNSTSRKNLFGAAANAQVALSAMRGGRAGGRPPGGYRSSHASMTGGPMGSLDGSMAGSQLTVAAGIGAVSGGGLQGGIDVSRLIAIQKLLDACLDSDDEAEASPMGQRASSGLPWGGSQRPSEAGGGALASPGGGGQRGSDTGLRGIAAIRERGDLVHWAPSVSTVKGTLEEHAQRLKQRADVTTSLRQWAEYVMEDSQNTHGRLKEISAAASTAQGDHDLADQMDLEEVDQRKALVAAIAGRPDGKGLGAQMRQHFAQVVQEEVAKKLQEVRATWDEDMATEMDELRELRESYKELRRAHQEAREQLDKAFTKIDLLKSQVKPSPGQMPGPGGFTSGSSSPSPGGYGDDEADGTSRFGTTSGEAPAPNVIERNAMQELQAKADLADDLKRQLQEMELQVIELRQQNVALEQKALLHTPSFKGPHGALGAGIGSTSIRGRPGAADSPRGSRGGRGGAAGARGSGGGGRGGADKGGAGGGASAAEVEKLSKELEAARQEAEAKGKEAEARAAELEAAHKELGGMQDTLTASLQQLASLRDEANGQRQRADAAFASIEVHQEAAAAAEARAATAEAEAAEAKAAEAEARRRMEVAESGAMAQAAAAAGEEAVAEARRRAEEAEAAAETLSRERDEAQAAAEELRQQVAEAEPQLEELVELRDEVVSLRERLVEQQLLLLQRPGAVPPAGEADAAAGQREGQPQAEAEESSAPSSAASHDELGSPRDGGGARVSEGVQTMPRVTYGEYGDALDGAVRQMYDRTSSVAQTSARGARALSAEAAGSPAAAAAGNLLPYVLDGVRQRLPYIVQATTMGAASARATQEGTDAAPGIAAAAAVAAAAAEGAAVSTAAVAEAMVGAVVDIVRAELLRSFFTGRDALVRTASRGPTGSGVLPDSMAAAAAAALAEAADDAAASIGGTSVVPPLKLSAVQQQYPTVLPGGSWADAAAAQAGHTVLSMGPDGTANSLAAPPAGAESALSSARPMTSARLGTISGHQIYLIESLPSPQPAPHVSAADGTLGLSGAAMAAADQGAAAVAASLQQATAVETASSTPQLPAAILVDGVTFVPLRQDAGGAMRVTDLAAQPPPPPPQWARPSDPAAVAATVAAARAPDTVVVSLPAPRGSLVATSVTRRRQGAFAALHSNYLSHDAGGGGTSTAAPPPALPVGSGAASARALRVASAAGGGGGGANGGASGFSSLSAPFHDPHVYLDASLASAVQISAVPPAVARAAGAGPAAVSVEAAGPSFRDHLGNLVLQRPRSAAAHVLENARQQLQAYQQHQPSTAGSFSTAGGGPTSGGGPGGWPASVARPQRRPMSAAPPAFGGAVTGGGATGMGGYTPGTTAGAAGLRHYPPYVVLDPGAADGGGGFAGGAGGGSPREGYGSGGGALLSGSGAKVRTIISNPQKGIQLPASLRGASAGGPGRHSHAPDVRAVGAWYDDDPSPLSAATTGNVLPGPGLTPALVEVRLHTGQAAAAVGSSASQGAGYPSGYAPGYGAPAYPPDAPSAPGHTVTFSADTAQGDEAHYGGDAGEYDGTTGGILDLPVSTAELAALARDLMAAQERAAQELEESLATRKELADEVVNSRQQWLDEARRARQLEEELAAVRGALALVAAPPAPVR